MYGNRVVLNRLKEELPELSGARLDIRFATLYYKSDCNKTPYIPNFYVHTAPKDVWIIFPHELDKVDLMSEEVRKIIKGE